MTINEFLEELSHKIVSWSAEIDKLRAMEDDWDSAIRLEYLENVVNNAAGLLAAIENKKDY